MNSVPDFTVVVGVDGSPMSRQAMDWALDEARLRGGRVRAITAWHYPALGDAAGAEPDYDEYRKDAEQVQTEEASRLGAAGVPVAFEVVHGHAAQALAEASHEADLLVVGSRGRGGFAGLLLGSVSSQLTHHAACPVLVVRPGRD